jgi:lipopolysaccharide export system protein LptA
MIRSLSQSILALSLLVLGPLSAMAQIGDSSLPMDVAADHMENIDTERRTILIGNVDITQGDRRLMADHVELHRTLVTDGGRGNVERVVATGNVRYFSPAQNARGDNGIYEIDTDTITLTGDVVIRQGENVITTTFFRTNLTTGNSNFGQENDGQRVRAVISTSGSGDDQADEPDDN